MNRGLLPMALATICGFATAVATFDPLLKEQQKKKFAEEQKKFTEQHAQEASQSLAAGETVHPQEGTRDHASSLRVPPPSKPGTDN